MSARISLKKTIVLFSILIGCVPLLLSGALFIHLFSGTLETEISQRNLVAARALGGEINRFLMDYRSLLEYASDRMNQEDGNLTDAWQNRLEDMLRRYDLFNCLKILDASAKVLVIAPHQPAMLGIDFSGHAFVQQALSTGAPAWSDVYLSATSGSPTISLAVPFRHGIVIGDMNLDILNATTQKIQTGTGSYAVVVDRTGVIISHPDHELVDQRLNVRNLSFIRAGLEGREGTFDYFFRGAEKIGSVARIPETGWLSTVVQPREEAFAAVTRMKSLLWTTTISIAMVMMIFSAWMHQKTIFPLLRLGRIVRRISNAEYDFQPMPESFIEIDQLSDAFQKMARAIAEREAALERNREAITRSEKELRRLYDSVSDLIYTHDLEGHILSANKAMSDVLGYDPAEIIGRSITEAMKPELHSFFRSHYLDRFQKHPSQKGVFSCFDRTGGKLYVEYASILVTDEDGRPFVTGIGRNVTERILAERSLRLQEARIEAILEAMPTPLAAYDTHGKLQFTNAAFSRIFGWSMEELQSNVVPFVPESEKEITRSKIRELYKTGKPGILETKRLTRQGSTIDVLISAALIHDKQGKAEGMVACFLDLTEKKKLEAGLIHAQKMEAIGTLAGGIAHDFNNLLMVIGGNTSLMMLDLANDERMMRRLRDIERNVRQGAGLTRQLLGFAKGGKYEVQSIDFNELIREHDEVFQRTRKDIRIEEHLQPGLPTVAADRSQMEQILMNIYINAGHAMPQGGVIRVSTGSLDIDADRAARFQVRAGRYVCIRIADTGIGMDETIRKRIFEPFFTTKEKGRGTGLGLASVYGIVQNHGGFIEVESELHRGTTFSVCFPATAVEAGSVAQPTETPLTASRAGGQKTILLVDDEEMVRDIGAQLLKHLGHRAITAESGQRALELYRENRGVIDLVILDMIMPGMPGGAVFDRLKEMDPDARVILSSGYSIDGDAQAILYRGCRGFLQKPFSIERLSRTLSQAFSDTQGQHPEG
ncbi:PAS domain S-box protein [Desulfatirhabdium butyrativorans]|uniref:PAS domain S-box protein n=1 Tax=Desulfatirhabdium butyrativorans TaxID=340467 RepID=UPI00041F526E|nr:PAS domain S-box protein [Desulfatirhabdium butyrativorans]